MKYSENELAALISEVETEFSKHLEKAEAGKDAEKLAKTEEVDAQSSASDEVVQTEATTDEVVAKSEDANEEEVSFDYSDEDVVEMNEMYASMTKSEKEAHYKSVKSELFGNEEPVEKTEDKIEKKEEVPAEEKVAKSEDADEVSDLKGKLEKSEGNYKELQKGFSDLIEKLTKSVQKSAAPKQKAITKIEYIAKSEENAPADDKTEDVTKLAKKEITSRLSEKARNPGLAKSDRDAINAYCLTTDKDIESIKHLL